LKRIAMERPHASGGRKIEKSSKARAWRSPTIVRYHKESNVTIIDKKR